MQFNPGDGSGIVDEINDICGSDNQSYPLPSKARRTNAALNRFVVLVMKVKNWRVDDTNNVNTSNGTVPNTGLPVAYARLRSGWDNYPFAAELLTLKSVWVMDRNGQYYRLDEETSNDQNQWTITQQSGSRTPTKFKLMGGNIVLDCSTDYDMEDGLMVEFTRAFQAILPTDTTKEPGIPSIFHTWLAQYAALPHLIELQKAQKNDIAGLEGQGEEAIRQFMGTRNQTARPRFVPARENNK